MTVKIRGERGPEIHSDAIHQRTSRLKFEAIGSILTSPVLRVMMGLYSDANPDHSDENRYPA